MGRRARGLERPAGAAGRLSWRGPAGACKPLMHPPPVRHRCVARPRGPPREARGRAGPEPSPSTSSRGASRILELRCRVRSDAPSAGVLQGAICRKQDYSYGEVLTPRPGRPSGWPESGGLVIHPWRRWYGPWWAPCPPSFSGFIGGAQLRFPSLMAGGPSAPAIRGPFWGARPPPVPGDTLPLPSIAISGGSSSQFAIMLPLFPLGGGSDVG